MEQVLQCLIDRSRAPLGLEQIKTILGRKRRPRYRPRKGRTEVAKVTVERPTYDLTVDPPPGISRPPRVFEPSPLCWSCETK